MIAKLSTDGKSLILTLPLNAKPAPSQSGKTLVVYSTGGFMGTGVKTKEGKDINISINATVKP